MESGNLFVGHTVLTFDQIPSTNDYLKALAKEKTIPEGTVVLTKDQTAGRGQKGNTWSSEKNKNLTFSIYLKPSFLQAAKQFYLSMVTAVAIIEFLQTYTIPAQIKWPNDILVQKKKICGILIENTLKGKSIGESIIGIGLNVKQQNFAGLNATSMTEHNPSVNAIDLKVLLHDILSIFEKYYLKLRQGKGDEIEQLYFSHLFGKDGMRIKTGDSVYNVKIKHINQNGSIVLAFDNGTEKEFWFKAFETIIE